MALKGTRHKNAIWALPILADGKTVSGSDAALAVAMDIRDELQEICKALRSIRRAMPPQRK